MQVDGWPKNQPWKEKTTLSGVVKLSTQKLSKQASRSICKKRNCHFHGPMPSHPYQQKALKVDLCLILLISYL